MNKAAQKINTPTPPKIPMLVLAWIAAEAALVKVIHATTNKGLELRCKLAAMEIRKEINDHLPWQTMGKPILIRSRESA